MNFGQIVAGQQYKWKLIEKLGEGDAGEVYLVESLLKNKTAILKRPRQDAFFSDMMRQAAQIRNEGSILKAISGISLPQENIQVIVPSLLDQSPPEEGQSERFFVVMERASGIDLKSLVQLTHFGRAGELSFSPSKENAYFVKTLATFEHPPKPILVRALLGVLSLLEALHNAEIRNEGGLRYGIVWNDIKPEHLYWDPARGSLTVIDWGNSAFLERDGISKDRQHIRSHDYDQFIEAMGGFLAEVSPDLHSQLGWPASSAPGSATESIPALKEKLLVLNSSYTAQLAELRGAAASLYDLQRPEFDHLLQSDALQQRFVLFGELPDLSRAVNFHARVALQMASELRLDLFQQVCQKTARLEASSSEKWQLLEEAAGVAIENSPASSDLLEVFSNALAAGVSDDWGAMLWTLLQYIDQAPLPEWWGSVSDGVRRACFQLDKEALSPHMAVIRVFYTLQAKVLQTGDKALGARSADSSITEDELKSLEHLLKNFNDEVVKKWNQLNPAPPHAGIGYSGVEAFIPALEEAVPGTAKTLENALSQPRAQAQIILDAWQKKDFETARKALGGLLLWDPDRRRLLQADRAIRSAAQWLSSVRSGAAKDEPFYDYLTAVELTGRELRNRVGAAEWLDLILESLKRLRKGTRPADLIMENPGIIHDIPWLNEYRSREILSLTRSRPMTLERDLTPTVIPRTISGMVEGRLGPEQEFSLGDPLDTWLPEARGSSARVFLGTLRSRDGKPGTFAVKVMRPDQIEYATPLFREEAQILSLLRDAPGVSPLVECGYLRIDEGLEFPSDAGHTSASHLQGQVVRFGAEETQNFLAAMDARLQQGWLPYLALVVRPHEQNLMKYCDAGYTHGWFLPLRESLLLAIQICDILQSAHDRNIVYRDHKILHYYWDPQVHGVVMIDWNIARRHTEGLNEADRQFDLSQFAARALHHIFTGRTAAGALPLGPNRPDEIEHASLRYPVNWTYDDERLPNRVKEILENVLNQGYTQVKELRADLVEVYEQIPDTVPALPQS